MRFFIPLALAFCTVLGADEVTLTTPTGTLYGTLLVPASSQAIPVVLMLAGSGPTDRDGNSILLPGPNNCTRMLAEALEARGIASLRYDKRGVGASIGALSRVNDLTFDIEIDDAARWLQQLRGDSRFSLRIVAGHSQGALIAIILAERGGVDRAISIAGGGRPAGDIILSQFEGQLSPTLMDAARRIITSLVAGIPVPNSMVPTSLRPYFDESLQPYLISWFRYDPALEIRRLNVPALIVQGTTDRQVPVSDALLLADADRSAALRIIEGMNHVLKDVPPDPDLQDRSESDPTLPIDKQLVAAVADFINPPNRRRPVR